MRKQLIILILITICIIGCKKQEDSCLPITFDFLQENWIDYGTQQYALGGRTYNFNLEYSDSFFMYKNYYTDQLYIECGLNNDWNIYAKGTWQYSNDLLILNGFYCDKNYKKILVSPCPQVIDTGVFYMEFNNVYYCNDTLVLQNTSMNDWQGLIKLKRE